MSKEGKSSISFEMDGDRSVAVARGYIDERDLRLLAELKPTHLELNSAKGWVHNGHVEFLKDIPPLESLRIIGYQMEDSTGVRFQSSVEQLGLCCYDNKLIDFSRFTQVKECWLYGRKGMQSLYDLPCLIRLRFSECSAIRNAAQGLERATKLVELSASQAEIKDLKQCGNMAGLQYLQANYCRQLTNLLGISGSHSLKRVRITACPCGASLSPSTFPPGLQRLDLSSVGEVRSLEWVRDLRSLESLCLSGIGSPGTTNVLDGKLSWLKEMPSLKQVFFKNRKHYDITEKELNAFLKARSS